MAALTVERSCTRLMVAVLRRLQDWAVGAALAVAVPHLAAAAPLRVMSLNECSDQLVLQLLPPAQITSITWLSRDPEGSQMWREARRVPVNHGLGEEVVRDHPDLIVAGAYTTPATRALLTSLHFPLLVLQPVNSFADIRRTTLQVAAAVHALPRARALLAHMDATLAALAAGRGPPLRVAAWDAAGFSATQGSLYDTLLKAAGAHNVAADGGRRAGEPDVEQLLVAAPALLVAGEPAFQKPGLRAETTRSPLVRRLWGSRTLVVPLSAYNCGTPLSADAAVWLRRQMRAAAGRAGAPLPYQASWTR